MPEHLHELLRQLSLAQAEVVSMEQELLPLSCNDKDSINLLKICVFKKDFESGKKKQFWSGFNAFYDNICLNGLRDI